MLAGCGGGGGSGDGKSPVSGPGPGSGGTTTQPVADFAPEVVGTIAVGHGIISPYRVMADTGRDDRLFVLTGRGETFSEGRLHVVEPDRFTDLADPIDVGSNGADLAQDGDHLVVAVRGSNRLTLVDLQGWRKLHDLPLDFSPGSIVSLGGGEFVCASVTDGSVVLVRRNGERLETVRRTSLGGYAYDLTVDADAQRIYVSQPLAGVAILDARTLAVIRRTDLPREPSRGIMMWGDYVVVSNRNGFLHFLTKAGALVETLDLADALGLDRATLPTRGIDPGDLVDLGDGRFVVVNGRQDSLLFEADPAGPLPARAVARLVGGAFAIYRAGLRTLYVTMPSSNAISKVAVPAAPVVSSRLGEIRIVTGAEIAAATPLVASDAAVAVLTSDGVVHVIDAAAELVDELRPPPGETWLPPMVATSDGGFAFVSRPMGGVPNLVHFDRQGASVDRHTIDIGSVYSASEQAGRVLLVSRLNRMVQFVDLSGGQSQAMPLQRDRARLAVPMGQDRWIVLHDTNPDIGITLLIGTQESGFRPFDDWFSAGAYVAGRGAVTASFNGSVTIVDERGVIERSRRTGLATLSDVQPGPDDTVWVTSENKGLAHRIRLSNLSVDARYGRAGIRGIGALPGTSLLWSSTARDIEVLK